MDISLIEQSLIGALIDRPETFDKIAGIVKADDFTDVNNRKIFTAIEHLYRDEKPYDLISLCSELHNRQILSDIGGRAYLTNCIQGYGTESSAPFWARRIAETGTRNKAKGLTAQLLSELSNGNRDNIQDKLAEYITRFAELQARTTGTELLTLPEIYHDTAKELEDLSSGKMKGVLTGLDWIDRHVGGFYPGEMITIAGDSGVGKTNFKNQILDKIAIEDKIPTLDIPLEMRQTALYKRLVLGRTGNISAYGLRTGKLTDAEWLEFARVAGPMNDGAIVMPKKHDLKFQDIQSLVYAAKIEFNIKVLVIDYFQLIDPGVNLPETQAQTYLSRTLKIMLLKYGLVGILLSQFRKRAPGAKGVRTLEDMRGSGALPSDSDFVFYLHRDKIEGTNKYELTGSIEMPKGREADTDYWDIYYKHPRFYETMPE